MDSLVPGIVDLKCWNIYIFFYVSFLVWVVCWNLWVVFKLELK